MLGQNNKKMLLEAKGKQMDIQELNKAEFITPIGEFALGRKCLHPIQQEI